MKVVLIFLVLFFLGIIFGGIFQAILAFFPGPQWFKLFAMNVLSAFILPIQAAPRVLLYYDLRIRKEAFDLHMLSSALHEPTTV